MIKLAQGLMFVCPYLHKNGPKVQIEHTFILSKCSFKVMLDP